MPRRRACRSTSIPPFNIVAALVFLPLVDVVAWACRRLLPDKPVPDDPGKPRHLDPNVLDSPAEALGCALRETLNLGDRVADMLRQTIDVFERNDAKAVKAIEAADNAVDQLYEAIKLYLVQISRNELGEEDGRRYVEILTFTTNLEHIGDIIDKNLMELAAKKIRNRYAFSAEGMAELRAFHARVLENLRLALNVFTTRDITLARRLVGEKASLREAEARGGRQPFRPPARGPAEIDRDQLDPHGRDPRSQAHQRPPGVGRLSDPRGGRRARRHAPEDGSRADDGAAGAVDVTARSGVLSP